LFTFQKKKGDPDVNFSADQTLLLCGVPFGQDLLGHYQI
jgi:hypothetical protein